MLGQSTTEHLVLLAIVLIIALIAIMLLGAPGLGNGIQMQTSQNYWRSGYPIAVIETYKESGNDTLRLKLRNTGAEMILIDYVDTGKGGNRNTTYFGGSIILGPGEDRIIDVNVPPGSNVNTFEYKMTLGYRSGGILYEFKGSNPLMGVSVQPVCSNTAGKGCGTNADCCVAAALTCQSGTCQSCSLGGELCSASSNCCTGACVPVFGYSACCIASGQACQAGGFPPPVPCCGASCSSGVCP